MTPTDGSKPFSLFGGPPPPANFASPIFHRAPPGSITASNRANSAVARLATETSDFSWGGRQRLNKDELKALIEQKNQALRDLQENKRFLDEVLDSKLKNLESRLKEIKPQVFDKVFKTALHYIYKHYENCKNGLSPEEASQILQVNLTHQKEEVANITKLNENLAEEGKLKEQRLREIAVKGGLFKGTVESFESATREEVEGKIRDLERENSQVESKIVGAKKVKERELMQLHIEMEKKGRVQMEERAIELALEFANESREWDGIRGQVHGLLAEIKHKTQAKKNHPYYQLLKKKEKLTKQLALSKAMDS